MIRSPANSSPKQKSHWKEKLLRLSSSSSNKTTPTYASLQRTPKGSPNAPSLSDSPTSTPGSFRHGKVDEDLFLTPLDVLDHDHDHEINNLLDNQIGMIFADWNIPPPPPKKKTGPNANKLQLLPASTISGPKIKPYFQTSSRYDTNINHESCFICGDILETKLDSEKLVPLECGDCVHGECLRAHVDVLSESLKSDNSFKVINESVIESKVFPICQGNNCISGKRSRAIVPISKDLISDIVADVILSVKISAMPLKPRRQKLTKTASLVFGVENRVSQHFFIDKQLLRPKSFISKPPSEINSRSTAVSTMENDVIYNNELHNKSLEDIKTLFIKRMLHKYSDFSLVVLVSLGSLRLVDRLQVAIKDENFEEHVVYLFSNFIVIETDCSSPSLFPLGEEHVITTPGTSVIQFVTAHEEIPALTLNSKTDAVIEKWGIALSDTQLILPSDVITSSISISEIVADDMDHKQRPTAARNKFELTLPIQGRADPRISLVSIIEPKEIWSDRPNNFADELMKMGVLPVKEPPADIYDAKPTSPLNIVKPQDLRTPTGNLSHPQHLNRLACLDIDFHSASDSDSDLDSDFELINTVMINHNV